MKNRSDTTAPASPASPDLASLPAIRSSRPRVPFGWPGGEPDSVRAACDAGLDRQRKGGR
ncbi:hypothetical protein [Streptosporangium sp. CA-115845]|uniref:hypothetical protein n=1 Tax=Streptosporangium sp. CA-115845 TaxID=3240071 RepID=UPI003D8A44F8